MRRIRANAVQAFAVVSAEIQADAVAMDVHAEAVDQVTSAVAGRLSYALTTQAPQAGVVFDVRIDPGDRDCGPDVRAFASVRILVGEIAGGRVVYCLADAARTSTVVHELGHTFGLRHSPDPSDLMFSRFVRGRSTMFTPREALTMNLMLQRRGGNKYPDNDRDVTASAQSGTELFICR